MKEIDSQKILYKKIGNDESFTPNYGVEPILKHIHQYVENKYFNYDRNMIVWCPFDKRDSEYVKQIQKIDFVDVVCSHIDNNQDFFNYEPEEWDIIVSK